MSPVGNPHDIVRQLDAWLGAADDEPLVIETSGSTGVPKRVVLSRRAVIASLEATQRRLGGAGRWLLVLPPTYVAGVQVINRSLHAGERPVLASDHPSIADAIAEGGAAFTSVVPTLLHRLVDDAASRAALADMHTVLVGGGPIDPALLDRARTAGINVVTTYGSAETAGGCVYDGVALDGVALALETDGRLRIAGPTLFEGYDADPLLTADVLVDGWFRSSDAARIDDDGRLWVLGRLDDMVVSGGVNVPGAAVARRLREHPQVADAEVLGVEDPEWGSRLVAFVVPTGGVPGRDALREWVAEVHPRSWAPRQVVVLAAVPQLANGKPDRVRLRALAEAPS